MNRLVGIFYLLQPDPIHCPERLKCGFSSNLVKRYFQHIRYWLELRLIKLWPCYKSQERAACRCGLKGADREFSAELCELPDVHRVVDRLDAFFRWKY